MPGASRRNQPPQRVAPLGRTKTIAQDPCRLLFLPSKVDLSLTLPECVAKLVSGAVVRCTKLQERGAKKRQSESMAATAWPT